MPKFIVDIWLDGYESEEEQARACEAFIKEQLDFSASSVKVTRVPEVIEGAVMATYPGSDPT